MSMRSEIRSVLLAADGPLAVDQIIERVHEVGTPWKRTSITQEVGRMVSRGIVVNLARHPKYQNIETQPSTYVLAE